MPQLFSSPKPGSPVPHPETFLRLDAVGTAIPPYRPTYPFEGPYIDSFHRQLAEGPLKDGFLIQLKNGTLLGRTIKGWLRREDALKLYEIAYFAEGDILELGSFEGLSTSILSRASRNSPRPKSIETVDLSPRSVFMTHWNLLRQGLRRGVRPLRGDATLEVRRRAEAGRRYGMVFVDHSHAYGPVYAVCRALDRIVSPGAFCLFHDWNDPRNYDPADEDYGVYQAVTGGLDPARFEFYGVYGCLALYRAT
jgi:methyltransferase family protein